ncbi:MAG TPA: SBBP repeat-containing protein, partial [Bryobacteraceae bacterium]|nr:SBBP repeat-containing protein [Bryobacteraceae bacterium]
MNWRSGAGRSGALRMRLAGANRRVAVEGADKLAGQVNYFLGSSAAGWRAAVPRYARVLLRNVYPDVDLLVYGSEKSIEFDFDLAAGADPHRIRMDFTGASGARIDEGALVLSTPAGDVRWSEPAIYQTVEGRRRRVNGRFVLEGGNRVRFAIGPYDRARALVIDPTISFATYFGGSNNEAARGIALDSSGNIYIAGYTTSRALPVSASAVQPAYGGDTTSYQTGDAFVAKFTPAGALAAMTYLGGSRDDLASSLAVDSSGNVYVTGYTNSRDFPITSKAYQQQFAGAGGNLLFTAGDAFVVKLNSGLSSIVYSTFLGGYMDEAGTAIAVDAAGNAYLTGITLSPNFPVTAGAMQTALRGSGGQPVTDFGEPFFVTGDAFVSKLSPDGSRLIFSTYLGGSQDDASTCIAVDSSGNVYVAGFTISTNFPTTMNAFQMVNKGQDATNYFYHLGDAFITKLNPSGTALLYSTYLGGGGDDAVTAIAVDAAGNLYATGATTSPDFPVTKGAFQTMYAGPFGDDGSSERIVGDAFAAKLKPDGSGLVFSTFLGGQGDDAGHAIAVDPAGNVFVGGSTASPNFPLTPDATQSHYRGAGGEHNNGDLIGDGFLAVLDPTAARAVFSTYLGGSQDDSIEGLAIDGADNIYAAGVTMSPDFPVSAGSYQNKFGGVGSTGRIYGDAFLVRLSAPNFSGGGPLLTAAGIVNAASGVGGAVAPGEIVVIYGSNMGPSNLAPLQLDSTGKVANSLAGTQVLFNNVAAPLIYTSAGQLAAVVPYEVAGHTSVPVQVIYNGTPSAAVSVPVTGSAPAFFTLNQQGTGQAAALNQDNSVNGPGNPAARGSVLQIFGTGEGVIAPALPDGAVASSAPFPSPALPVSATIDGQPAQVQYKGTAPGGVAGFFQVNLVLPDGARSGTVPV